ncbi:hypothetical protein [Parageobacillus sp. G301]|uniref:hypothetical protein n=1 Tax=Parageobacillus sp. G301 TaxID=2998290 RepID=UPI002497C3B5|nr:hypothetical protein [Parageobacillus sp. G301]GLH65070.1 hypothetical protein PG301_29090 [Parageobacillus sp. G301]
MGIKKETFDMLLLLSAISNKSQKLSDALIEKIKKTPEYQVIQNVEQYHFITPRAKELKAKLQNIHIDKNNIADIQQEYRKLETLYEEFQHFLTKSNENIQSDNYRVDIISKKQLDELKKTNEGLYRKIQVVLTADEDNIAEAFRNYIKLHPHPDIIEEYKRIRSSQMEDKDNKRAKTFQWGGALIGSFVFVLILKMLLPVSKQIELGIIGASALLFALGLAKLNHYLRLYSVSVQIGYIVFFVLVSFAQEFGFLPNQFNFMKLRELHLLFLMAMFGALIGFIVGPRFNFIPARLTIRLPAFVNYVERQRFFLLVVFSLFGYIWTAAFMNNMNVYHWLAAKIEEQIDKKAIDASASAEKPLGQVRVKSLYANLRTEPSVNKKTIFKQAKKGTIFDYYGSQKINGRVWYRVLEKESGKMVWISEITVDVIK